MSLITLGIWIAAIYAAVVAALNFLPTYQEYPLPPEFFDAIQAIFSFMFAWDSIFPIVTLLYAVSILITFEFAVYLWKGLRWFIGFLRGSTD